MTTFDGLTPPYSTIVVDPPWHYDERVTGWQGDKSTRGPMPYAMMSTDDIAALPVAEIAARGAHLYLWTTNRYLWAARDIVDGWGFDPAQVLTWCKPPRWRPGAVFGMSTEFIIFARGRTAGHFQQHHDAIGSLIRQARQTAGLNRRELHESVRGGNFTGLVWNWENDLALPNAQDWERLCAVLPDLKAVPAPKREPSRIYTSWWQWPDTGHSTKPPAFLDIVEQVSPAPRVELFARAPRLGWDSWGHGFEIPVAR